MFRRPYSSIGYLLISGSWVRFPHRPLTFSLLETSDHFVIMLFNAISDLAETS